MRAEMAPFGVYVTAPCPGSFRTDWAGCSMVRTDDLADKVATAIALVDGIQSLSYAMHGKVTTHYAEESARAAVSYLRSFLPDVVPAQGTDEAT